MVGVCDKTVGVQSCASKNITQLTKKTFHQKQQNQNRRSSKRRFPTNTPSKMHEQTKPTATTKITKTTTTTT